MNAKTEDRRLTRSELSHAEHISKGGSIHIALDWVNLAYTPEEGDLIMKLCNGGMSIFGISDRLRRPIDDLFAIIWTLSKQGKIKSRPGEVWGYDTH